MQFARLHLVTNNSRFLLLPGAPRNLGSRVLSLCTRRMVTDWPVRFGHEVLVTETFVDPARFRGTVYRAASWTEVGRTRGFARSGPGYREATHHILDWSFDEDRSRIRCGHGPQNLTALRRFAIGLIHGRGLAVAETMRRLARNPRRVLDLLKMTANTAPRAAPA